jgi:hypothetical protein
MSQLDTHATNKPTLFEMSDSMPGAWVLDGNWGLEHMAIAIPRGRDQGLPFVEAFVKEVQSDGLLEQIRQKAGLRGAIKAEPNSFGSTADGNLSIAGPFAPGDWWATGAVRCLRSSNPC